MNFGNWKSTLHDSPEQIKRLASGLKISPSKFELDKNNETGFATGSSETPYKVTLNTCTCGDFISRHLPCKYIYHLAFELGYISDLPTLNTEIAKSFIIEKEIKRYYDFYKSGAISIDKFVKIADALQKGK